MSDYGTMLERIKYELPRGTSTDDTRVTLAIISAIERNRHIPFFFNVDTATFATTAGEQAYGNVTAEGAGAGYPDDLLGILTLFVNYGGDIWTEAESVPIDEIRREFVSDSYRGYANKWSWYNNQIYLDRNPHVAYDIRLDYLKDIGTPVATYDGAWNFYEEDGSTALASAYTNSWFTSGEELIRTDAKIDLHENWLKDDRSASRLRRRLDEIKHIVKARGEAQKGRKTVTPYA